MKILTQPDSPPRQNYTDSRKDEGQQPLFHMQNSEDKRSLLTIPLTSSNRYLGGVAALNLPSPDGEGTGDWHFMQIFCTTRKNNKIPKSFISGEGCATDTNKFCGSVGIFDATAIVRAANIKFDGECVWAANHARACADLALSAVIRGQSPDFVVLDDWMPHADDKRKVFEIVNLAFEKLSNEQKEKIQEWKTKNCI